MWALLAIAGVLLAASRSGKGSPGVGAAGSTATMSLGASVRRGGTPAPKSPVVAPTLNPAVVSLGRPIKLWDLDLDPRQGDPIALQPPSLATPKFTDLGRVAPARPSSDPVDSIGTAAFQRATNEALSEIPIVGHPLATVINDFFEPQDAASLSPQQERYLQGTGTQYALATGTASGSSSQLAAAQEAVNERLNAVENSDGTKLRYTGSETLDFFVAQGGVQSGMVMPQVGGESFVRIGRASGEANDNE